MSNFNDLDLSGFNFEIPILKNQVSAINDQMEESWSAVSEHNARKDAALFETAEASRAQKELLAQQLEEVKEQNTLLKENNTALKENYSTLKKLYDMTRAEAESSAKDAKHNKIFGWVSFAVGTVIGIAGIIIGIIV